MERISEILRLQLAKQPGWQVVASVARLREVWRDVVGDQSNANSEVRKLSNGILFISASSPSWAHQLSLRKPVILKELAMRGFTFSDLKITGAGLNQQRK